METTTIALSLASRLTRLMPLPGHDPHKMYGVLAEGLPQPADGLGYVVEIKERRHVQVVAWIQRGMSLWACETPLARAPRTEPDLAFLRDEADSFHGVVRLKRTGLIDVAHWTTGEHQLRYGLDLPPNILGTYAGEHPAMAIRTLAAVAWIALMEKHPAFVDALGAADLLSVLSSESLPDAIDLIQRKASSSPIARALTRELKGAKSAELRALCAAHSVDGVFLQTTRLFWIRFNPSSLTPKEQALLLSIEAIINRTILGASWILEHKLGAVPLDDELWHKAERHACLGILRQVPALYDASHEANPRLEIFGYEATRGGEWDVRTRFALAMNYLRLPTRLECRFDANVAKGQFICEFVVPPASTLPHDLSHDGAVTNAVESSDDKELRRAYGLRLALLIAAAIFGTSVAITKARVVGFDGSFEGASYLVFDGDRIDFAQSTLSVLRDQGSLPLLMSAEALAQLLQIQKMLGWGENALRSLVPWDLQSRHLKAAYNSTPLPQELADFLRANVVSDLDVYGSVNDPQLQEITKIMDENGDAPLIAIMELEGLLARINEENDSCRPPLYCSNGTDRLIVDLAPGGPKTRYGAIRDAVYGIKVHLSRLYSQLGDALRALEAAQDCTQIAPTTAQAHIDLAEIYARLERFDEADKSLRQALKLIITPQEAAYTLYRLAFALWQEGELPLAAAAYVIAAEDEIVGDQSKLELQELQTYGPLKKIPTALEARALLTNAGIALPVVQSTLHTLARAVLGLVDAEVFDPTWQGLLTLVPALGGDDMAPVMLSLKTGTPRTP